ncbi:Ubiquitin-conjugating enzyme spm2 [Penicillium malachiteum]|uniref:Ubiquitin-conjugating enzyme spm2 n=1 Tax=Penicillium malachiteum TaxID=1324776 RepID=UPI002547A10A|nr:Ubiquitin-conjugating enzyme spm2 [Penicillium malachiteum]KAJ5729990.1 Ubiquitin-conjugating enzyme spm2 [Penicillium malachiteum]
MNTNMPVRRQALDLLDSANKGNKQDEHRIIKTLAEARSRKEAYTAMQREVNNSKPPIPLSPRAARKQETLLFEKQTQRRHPNTPSILSRPNIELSGERHVPVLVNARGIPFLRLKKPQPKNLSGVIRAKLEKRWNRIVLRERLQTDLLFAKDEEAWDRIIGVKSERESGTWSEAVKTSLDYVRAKIVETDQQNREMAEKMWNIVLQERKLAEEEKQKQAEGKSS